MRQILLEHGSTYADAESVPPLKMPPVISNSYPHRFSLLKSMSVAISRANYARFQQRCQLCGSTPLTPMSRQPRTMARR